MKNFEMLSILVNDFGDETLVSAACQFRIQHAACLTIRFFFQGQI